MIDRAPPIHSSCAARRVAPLACWVAIAFFAGAAGHRAAAEDAGSSKTADALPSHSPEARVAVLLARNGLACHNPSDRKGGLDLTRREQALKGGDSGPVLRPGDPEHSLLWRRAEAGEMPPKGEKLSRADRVLLRDWVATGAKWASDPI